MSLTVDRDPQAPDGPEALIAEARGRARRRRARAVIALAALVGLVGGLLASRGGATAVVHETANVPYANLEAFSGHGELAFVSRGAVWVMDGSARSLRRLPVPRGFIPDSPQFSHDGRWLAYTASRAQASGADEIEVWLARANGTAPRVVAGPNVDQLVGWSPSADLLALTTYRNEPFAPYPAVTRLDLVAPPASKHTLVHLAPTRARPDSIWSATWSPDGRQVAVSTVGAVTAVDAYPVSGGRAVRWFRIANDKQFPDKICSACGGASEVIADLAGWWPRWGIGFWVFCCGAVHDNDGSPLALMAHPRARPRVLATTLSDGVTDAVSGTANGSLALVADDTGPGREIGQGKAVQTCDPGTRACAAVPGATTWIGADHQRCVIPRESASRCLGAVVPPAGEPGSGVSLDPSWAPNGRLLAYVRAPLALTEGWPDAAWYAEHVLYLWNARTGTTRRIAALRGANVPTWSADGRDLLYVRDDALWLAPVAHGSPVEVAGPLFSPKGLFSGFTDDYYGQIAWDQQFSWWTP